MTRDLRAATTAALCLGTVLLVALPAVASESSLLLTPLLVAYVGPGAGLGFVGSLLAVAAAVALALIGLIVYPLKLVLGLRHGRSVVDPVASVTELRDE